MLGCHDFCGYYDWTFHHVRHTFGQAAVERLWAEAIGGEAQKHYLEAVRRGGLRGLLNCWTRTGEDEDCDWTFTLDEARNVLRWDMRACPSKGFLLGNDLNGDEDYCDHCMGWIIPLLDQAGVEVAAHEHNHCGQCWAEIRVRGKPYEPLKLGCDIRCDPRWSVGYLDRWASNQKLPVAGAAEGTADPAAFLLAWLRQFDELVVLGRGPSALEPWLAPHLGGPVLLTDSSYTRRDVFSGEPAGVLIGDGRRDVGAIAERYLAAPPERRPLLMHLYLPGDEPIDFVSAGLPRPAPVLSLLIRQGLYTHRAGEPYPTTGVFLAMLAMTSGKPVTLGGIDLYQHASGKIYAGQALSEREFTLPPRHSRACDLQHLRRAVAAATGRVQMPEGLRRLLQQSVQGP